MTIRDTGDPGWVPPHWQLSPLLLPKVETKPISCRHPPHSRRSVNIDFCNDHLLASIPAVWIYPDARLIPITVSMCSDSSSLKRLRRGQRIAITCMGTYRLNSHSGICSCSNPGAARWQPERFQQTNVKPDNSRALNMTKPVKEQSSYVPLTRPHLVHRGERKPWRTETRNELTSFTDQLPFIKREPL